MAFKVYDRNRGRMFVSCRKGAALVFSAGCKSFFEGIRQVELYIDRDTGMAAVMGCAAGSGRSDCLWSVRSIVCCFHA